MIHRRSAAMLIVAVMLLAACESPKPKRGEWTPPPNAPAVTETGWLKEFPRPGGTPAIRLQTKERQYWVTETPIASFVPLPEESETPAPKWLFGPDHIYTVKGYVGEPVSMEWFGSLPVLYGVEFQLLP